ncbi:alpha/beta hydrolase [Hyphococcus flavus]|uniref:Proline iminopeptidase n=1 Tax=Hyphococcus flavus TaxID=1866326 RepID=A0AAF0CBR2_9PROT|nr:alpha/beta hydrolase [Hyphococcus flavus]WDI31630.1 alpha/beta hydrolase [Hyphococcus flavus]
MNTYRAFLQSQMNPFGVVALAICVLLTCPATSFAEDNAKDEFTTTREIIGDYQRITTPNGVEESFIVNLNGARQYVSVRGNDRANPIILFVHGGPAAPEMPIAWAFQDPWEEFFTVVQWDQRAAGKSFPLNEPQDMLPTLKPEQYRDDVISLIEHLNERYGKRKVILMGHSWGSIPGLMTAAERPDLLHAYVSLGQIIDFREGERIGFEQILRVAREDGNSEAIAELEGLEPYPGDGDFSIEKIGVQRKWSIQYGYLSAGRNSARAYFRAHRLSPEYGPADVMAWQQGSAFTIQNLLPKLADVSFKDVTALDVPVFMFMGRHDYTTPNEPVVEWLTKLDAPHKQEVWFENSAHVIPADEPGKALFKLVTQVRPFAVNAGDGAPIE